MFLRRTFALLFLAGLLVMPSMSLAAEPAAKDSNPTDGDALGFAVTTLATPAEELNSLALYGEKPVVLVFWATWCGPCLKEIPHVNALSKEYGDKVQFVGISIDTAPSPAALETMVLRAAKVRKIDYPIALDTGGTLEEQFEITGIPFIYGVDLDGNEHTKLGLTDEKALRAFVEALF